MQTQPLDDRDVAPWVELEADETNAEADERQAEYDEAHYAPSEPY